ncbi:MAG: endolytic transglycosylase MltG [bacterium]
MSGKTVLVVCLAIALIVFGVVGSILYSTWKGWTSPWGTPDQEFLIDIEPGMSAEQIAGLLMEREVLKGTTFFLIMADLQGFAGDLKAGEYRIAGASSPNEIVDMIGRGAIYLHRVVFPEGITRNQIAEIYEENHVCSAADFLAATGGGVKQDVDLKADSAISPGVEGFLFPDTYYMEKNCDPIRLRERMMRRFNQVYKELEALVPDGERWWQTEQDGSIPVLVALASLVEREAKLSEDRPLVASVFRNRIKKGMPLQSDATIHYILGDWTRPLTKEDFEIDDPYNTFKNKGLSPTPICNPGRESLWAAMRPAETSYLYFMATGDGKTEFSESLNEHNQMRRRVRSERSSQ